MYLSQRVQEHQLVGGQIDMGPIESLRLVFARQSKEDQHMISSVRQLDRLLQQLLVVLGRPNAKTSGKAHFCTASQYRPQLLQRQPARPGSRCSVRASSTNANVQLRVRLRAFGIAAENATTSRDTTLSR